MIGLRALAEEREWDVAVVPLIGSDCRSTVGKGKGVSGSSQDLRDREGRWTKDHIETRAYASR